jgi:peptide methionine sulfoxide reductase MsrA
MHYETKFWKIMNPITKNDSKVDNGNNYNNLKISKDKNEKESKINY